MRIHFFLGIIKTVSFQRRRLTLNLFVIEVGTTDPRVEPLIGSNLHSKPPVLVNTESRANKGPGDHNLIGPYPKSEEGLTGRADANVRLIYYYRYANQGSTS